MRQNSGHSMVPTAFFSFESGNVCTDRRVGATYRKKIANPCHDT